MCGLFLATVLTVGIWSFVKTPIYQATATVLIEPEPPAGSQHPGSLAHRLAHQDYYRTQYEIITSRPILEKVIETLNLRKADAGTRPIGRSGSNVPERRHRRAEAQHAAACSSASRAPTRRWPPRSPTRAGPAVRQAQPRRIKLKGAQEALAWLTEQMEHAAGQGAGVLGGAAELPREGRDHGAAGAAADHRPEDHGLQQAVSGKPGASASRPSPR